MDLSDKTGCSVKFEFLTPYVFSKSMFQILYEKNGLSEIQIAQGVLEFVKSVNYSWLELEA